MIKVWDEDKYNYEDDDEEQNRTELFGRSSKYIRGEDARNGRVSPSENVMNQKDIL